MLSRKLFQVARECFGQRTEIQSADALEQLIVLREHPLVMSAQPAAEDEDGSAATIVELK